MSTEKSGDSTAAVWAAEKGPFPFQAAEDTADLIADLDRALAAL